MLLPLTTSSSVTIDNIRRASTLEAALERISYAVGRLHPVSRASVRIVDPQDPDFLVLAGVWSAGPTSLTPGTRMPIRSTSFREVARSGSAVVPDESALDHQPPLLDGILRDEGVRSWVTLPLHDDDLIAGLVSLSSSQPGAFTKDSRVLFGAIRELCEDRLLDLAHRDVQPLTSRER